MGEPSKEADASVRVRNWMERQVEKEARRDALSFPDRMGQIAGLVCSVIVVAFVAIHQTRPTGFFTDEFGTLAAVLLYGGIIVGMAPVVVRLIVGSKNQARPFEVVSMVVSFVAMIYLLAVFPFDFAHFAEPLPSSLEFLLDWISATLAKIVLGIGILVTAVMSVHTLALYIGVKRRPSEPAPAEQNPGQ